MSSSDALQISTAKQSASADKKETKVQPQIIKLDENPKQQVADKVNALRAKEKIPSKYATNLERFHYICKDLPSPTLFVDFDFYFLISSCLARKVWIGEEGELFRLYPNLFIICVGDPGIGKSLPAAAVNNILSSLIETRLDKKTNQLYETRLVNLGPDAITFEKLILRAAASSDIIKDKTGKWYQHSSTSFCLSDEMGMLFTENTKRVAYFLTQAWDCRKYEGDTIKHGEINIPNICVNFLGCTTPNLMGSLMRTRILEDGFTARTIFIYGDKKRFSTDTIKTTKEQENEQSHIKDHLRALCKLPPSKLTYSPEAIEWRLNWIKTKEDDHINLSRDLKDYYGRKRAHLEKMAINVHFSDKVDYVVTVEDFIKAERLLLAAEVNMHKALAASGENPIYEVSEKIKNYIKDNGGTATKQKLNLMFFPEVKNGLDDMQRIFDFLETTEQVTLINMKGKPALTLQVKNKLS